MLNNIFKRTFIKYLLSYIICLILPVCIFSFLYMTVFISAYTDQLMEKTSRSLNDSFENIDIRIGNLRETSSRIFLLSQFSDSYLDETPGILAFLESREILRILSIPNEFIFDIWMFNSKSKYLLSSNHLLSYDSVVRYGPSYHKITDNFFEEIIGSVNGEVWVPETTVRIFNNSHSLLTYITGYPNSITHSNSVLMILIKQELFDHALRAIIPYERSTVAVIDREGRIIYSLNPDENLTLQKIPDISGLSDGAAIIKIDNHDYYVNIMSSAQNPLTYISLIPYRELSSDVQKYTVIFFYILLGIILCGSVLIFLLMRYNYNPLQRIVRFSSEYIQKIFRTGDRDFPPSNDEIDLIRNTLEIISEEYNTLSMKNEKHQREALLFSLLKGNHVSTAVLAEAGIDCSASHYMVLIFQLEKKTRGAAVQLSDFETAMRNIEKPFVLDIHLLEYLEQNSFIGIITCREETSDFHGITETLCLETEKGIKCGVKIACGSPVKFIEEISRSYSEAKIALRYQLQNTTGKITEFKNMDVKTIPDYLYLQSELNTLEESVKTKNTVRTAFIVSELVDTIKNENTSYFYAVCLCYNIINIFIQEVHQVRNATAMDIIKKHQMLFLENFDHPVENLITIVLSLSRETMRILGQGQTEPRIANRANILKFIEENYRNSDFCIQSILDHFNMSFSNLSHQFKSYTGENISSYISALKIQYAKELLSTSSLSVNGIAAKLGYFQTSSFIKKFRSAEGMTPGEYRQKQQEGKQKQA